MLFSRNWLQQYVELDDGSDDLSSCLTAAGFNVEGVEEGAGDVQFDLEITTNRSDCMNHLGLARELAVIYDRELRSPAIDKTGAQGPLEGVDVTDTCICPPGGCGITAFSTIGTCTSSNNEASGFPTISALTMPVATRPQTRP